MSDTKSKRPAPPVSEDIFDQSIEPDSIIGLMFELRNLLDEAETLRANRKKSLFYQGGEE